MSGISDEDKKVFDSVIARYDAHFKVRKNLIFEREKECVSTDFNKNGESIELFITSYTKPPTTASTERPKKR